MKERGETQAQLSLVLWASWLELAQGEGGITCQFSVTRDLFSVVMPTAGWCWVKAVHPGICTPLIPGACSHLECWETLSERNACAARAERQAAPGLCIQHQSALWTAGIMCGVSRVPLPGREART